MSADRFESQRPPGAPVHVVPAPQADGRGAPTPRPPHQPLARSGRVSLLMTGNAVVAYAVLAVMLPAPWGILMPIAALAQVAIVRHGVAAALAAAMLGCGAGGVLAVLRASRGAAGDPARLACAGVLVGVTVLAAWPRHDAPAGRSGRPD